ncbi:MAG: Ldh family oxidoreductase [Planctomycetaceae bacterium]
MAPFGGIDRRLSANPMAAGVPTNGEPLILDMSACTIAEGKIRVALNKGERVPDNCIIDSTGRPTDDPAAFYTEPGSILPIAGHKGYALSVMIEMLAGALTGSSCTNPKNNWRVVNGMLSIIIDRSRFGSAEEFFPEVARFIEFVKSSRTVAPNGEILVPGEIEQRTKASRLSSGIELDETTWRQIHETCERLGVEHSFARPGSAASGAAEVVIPGSEAAPTDRR